MPNALPASRAGSAVSRSSPARRRAEPDIRRQARQASARSRSLARGAPARELARAPRSRPVRTRNHRVHTPSNRGHRPEGDSPTRPLFGSTPQLEDLPLLQHHDHSLRGRISERSSFQSACAPRQNAKRDGRRKLKRGNAAGPSRRRLNLRRYAISDTRARAPTPKRRHFISAVICLVCHLERARSRTNVPRKSVVRPSKTSVSTTASR